MTDGIGEGLLRLHHIADAYADAASVSEALGSMALSPSVVPIVQLPPKPAPARARYLTGAAGGVSVAAVGFVSNVGIGNNESASRLILQIYAVTVINATGGDLSFTLRQIRNRTGYTEFDLNPAYVDAGPEPQPGISRIFRNNLAAAEGQEIFHFRVSDGESPTFPFEGVLNNGAFLVTGSSQNADCRAIFWYRTSPILYTQLPG